MSPQDNRELDYHDKMRNKVFRDVFWVYFTTQLNDLLYLYSQSITKIINLQLQFTREQLSYQYFLRCSEPSYTKYQGKRSNDKKMLFIF